MAKLLTNNNPNYHKEYGEKSKEIPNERAKQYYIKNRKRILENLKNKKKKPLTEAQKERRIAYNKAYNKEYYKKVLKFKRQKNKNYNE